MSCPQVLNILKHLGAMLTAACLSLGLAPLAHAGVFDKVFDTSWIQNLYHPDLVSISMNKAVIELVIVFLLLAFLFWKLTQIRQARGFLWIFSFTIIGYFAARFTGFQIIARLLEMSVLIGVLGFLVMFQPELRRFWVPTGSNSWIGKMTGGGLQVALTSEQIVSELMETLRILSKRKIGALIVYETDIEHRSVYLEIGTPIGAKLSNELLLTIFHPNTPLHDGAVIITPQGEIALAGVLLPLSENSRLSREFGTRHRAAIGLSEVSNNTCIVVSEETGRISIMQDGQINRLMAMEETELALKALVESTAQREAISDKRAPFLGDLFSVDFFQKFFTGSSASR